MKKHTIAALLMIFLSGVSLSAKSFDWSQCWCNYGGGIHEGDFIVNISGGISPKDLSYAKYDGFWFIPPVMAEVQYAQPIWKLPFTFGGYAGIRGYGYKFDVTENGKLVEKNASYWGIFLGGEAEYHMRFPPEGLDLFAVTRIGINIPFVKPGKNWEPDYFQAGGALGANWFFNDLIGVNLEFGFPFSKFGVSFKF